ncbi:MULTISPECIES: PIG-L deacetylase family protein [Thermus]|jgi:LmbE family N-acetylglucosaminyl deacetylase|uniref:Glucosamine-6-phosphate deaminase-like protein n=1 Tax=Thermus brockianus TaxID=56956 RepID=A0A1J0LWG9_THEBO|nr:PIG-L family deacetylase [Thermus brockianus]APD10490.1 glucosamine-6-phosphate deaminase-like protein [Thermus brockianus]
MGSKWLWWLLVLAGLAALFINAPWLLQQAYAWYYRGKVGGLPPYPDPLKVRLLVLAPHPDDESLAAAGLMQKVLRAGGEVYIAWMTLGDGFQWDAALLDRRFRPTPEDLRRLALVRMGEAKAAARTLGVPEDHLFFLGYPDRGLLHLFLENFYAPYRSPATRLDHVAYPGTLSPGAPYTGEAWEEDLKRVWLRAKPDLVLVPAPEDAHVDHRATAYMALRLMGERSALDRLRFYIVHGGLEWPLPKGLHPGLYLEPPPRGRHLPWWRLDLSTEEAERKFQALRAHRSQMEILGRFMEAFVRRNELFSRPESP